MKRPALILLSMLMGLMIEPLGPWLAQNRVRQLANTNAARSVVNTKSHPALIVPFDEGRFRLTDLRLVRAGGSTKLNGKLVNQTKRAWPSVVFAIRAYDSNGRQLRGVERQTIFGFNQLAKDKSAPINSGYGVWLEGIPLSAIARLEVVLLDDESPAAHADRQSLSIEIEE
ncbi:MAG: hypothetical protein ICV68_06085 [Pyrinomonadaceae bacterium]|nr:hypothetical protein [Pyrinomonadaceae bacterium]